MREYPLMTGRKADIIQAALSILLEKGYHRTRIDDIIERVGIAKGTFYYHFQSKVDVLEAVVQHLISHYIGAIEDISQSNLPASEKLLAVWECFNDLEDISRIFEELLDDEQNSTFLARLVRQGIKASLPVHEKIIRQGIQEGSVPTPYPEMAAKAFGALAASIFSLHTAEEMVALGHFAERILETDRPYLTGISYS